MKQYIRLMRPKHWIKNGLIFAALLFGGRLFEWQSFLTVLAGTLAYCFVSSAIYIINDIRDVESDRKHEQKRHRPLASGKVSVGKAWVLFGFMVALAVGLSAVVYNGWVPVALLALYLLLNIGYSFGLKKVPIIDICILMSGFVLRVLYGAQLIDQPVSHWLYLTVMAMSFYLGLGKRRNELNKHGNDANQVRDVLKHYNVNFLDKNMYMCLGLVIVFYALWSVDPVTTARLGSRMLAWTVPLLIVICMKYSLIVETGEHADPVDVLLGDKVLLLLAFVYAALLGVLLYGNNILTWLQV